MLMGTVTAMRTPPPPAGGAAGDLDLRAADFVGDDGWDPDPPPPEAVSVHSDDSDAPVAVLLELNEFDPRFLPGASDCDAISAICVQSSSAASSHQH